MRYWSYTLHSFLINLLGVLLVTGLHLWDFAIWLIAPLFLYWISMLLSTVRIRHKSVAKSLLIAIALLLGHLLELGVAFVVTGLLGQKLSRLIPGGVEILELFFTNSMNSVAMGSVLASIGSFLLVHFYFSRPRVRPADKASISTGT